MSKNRNDFLKNAEVDSGKSKPDNNIHLEKGESIKVGFGMDRFTVSRTSIEGRYVADEVSMKLAHLDDKYEKTAKKAKKVHRRTQKTVFHMEKVYDPYKGTYTFKPVAHRVDKDFESRRKRGVSSKGKEFLKKSYQTTKKMIADELPNDDGYLDGVEKTAKTSVETFKAGSRLIKNSNLSLNQMRSKHLQNKADWLKHSAEARWKFEKDFAKEIGRGNISQNAAKRALQKEAMKARYKKQAVMRYAQEKSNAFAFLTSSSARSQMLANNKLYSFITSSSARKKMLEEAARAIKKYLIIGGSIILLLGALLGGCAAMFGGLMGGFGGSITTAALGVYLADADELEQAENYYNQLEMLFVKAICNFRSEYYTDQGADNNGVFYRTNSEGVTTEYHIKLNYSLEAVKHNPNTLLNYLTAMYDDFTFDEYDLYSEVPYKIRDLFFACYGVSVPGPTTTPLEDITNGFSFSNLLSICDIGYLTRSESSPTGEVDEEGKPIMETHEWIDLIVTVGGKNTFRSLEDVVMEKLAGGDNAEAYEARFEILQETNGGLQRVNYFLESDWRDRVQYYYGNNYTYTNPMIDGWSPDTVSVPDGASRTESFRTYIGISCPSAENIHAGMIGTVIETGSSETGSYYVIIQEQENPAYCVIYDGLLSVNASLNQTVTAAQVIGTCNSTLKVGFTENGGYRNPMIYIN